MATLLDWGCAALGYASCDDAPGFFNSLLTAGAIGAVWLLVSLGIGLVLVIFKS